MGYGPIKAKEFIVWSYLPFDVSKLNVNGVARGKPGPIGIRGVLQNIKFRWDLFMFFKNARVCDCKEAEVLAILKALRCFLRF